ncbi:YegP family protein [Nitrosovibrio tenuis]|nr:YegP family protein [Nitrosovibrio tenuis]
MYFILYKSVDDSQWYWQCRADNHEPVADGAEGYVNKEDALYGIKRVKGNAATAGIYDDYLAKWIV